MENHYTDRFRCNRQQLQQLRKHLRSKISGRACIVLGSAPNPTIPKVEDALTICVNGSVNSAQEYMSTTADMTFLNGAIFNDEDTYSNTTLRVLKGKSLGDLLIARNGLERGVAILRDMGTRYDHCFPISKYDKRVIIGESFGRKLLGRYPFDANISNGFFMSVVALWAEASAVILAGFSFNNSHDYSQQAELSKRGHLQEDQLYLKHLAQSQLPVYTTEQTILDSFELKPWKDQVSPK